MDETASNIATYFEQFPLRTYGKGQLLIHAHDNPRYIYYIVSGKVRQYAISYRGDEIVVNLYKPGAFFPMMSAVTGRPNQFFFGAEAEVEVRIAPQDAVLQFLRHNPAVTYDLLTRLYIGVDGLLGRVAQLMAGDARSRLLYELHVECQRFGKDQAGGCLLTTTIADLATHTGLTRETASRELQKMAREGLVKTSRNGIWVADLKRLASELDTVS